VALEHELDRPRCDVEIVGDIDGGDGDARVVSMSAMAF
jgi:hypothetical protein